VCCGGQLGATALLVACRSGHLDVAQWLVTLPGIDARLERDNVSLFLFLPSLRAASVVLTVAVLPRGDVNHVTRCDQNGFTALLLACESGRFGVAQWLATEAGSDAASERDNQVSCAVCCRWRSGCVTLSWRRAVV
jgi:ankyrin repeat protein